MKFIDPRTGWKTYAVVIVGVGIGALEACGVHLPGWVDWVLAFLGLGAIRHGVQSQSATLAATIIQAITVPDPNADVTGATVRTQPVEQHNLNPIP